MLAASEENGVVAPVRSEGEVVVSSDGRPPLTTVGASKGGRMKGVMPLAVGGELDNRCRFDFVDDPLVGPRLWP